MPSSKPILTFHARRYGPNGYARPVAVSLPYIASIAADPHYIPPPPAPPSLPGERRAVAVTDRFIRIGRDPEKPLSARDRLAYEATLRRIGREGA